jgi:hypothetical protein
VRLADPASSISFEVVEPATLTGAASRIMQGMEMNADLATEPSSLSAMRRVLAEASRRLGVEEGSLRHEQLALRVLRLFEATGDADEVLAASIVQNQFDVLDAEDEIALTQLGAAVILMWHEIGASARAEILRTATTIAGIKRTADAGERLLRLISVHQD